MPCAQPWATVPLQAQQLDLSLKRLQRWELKMQVDESLQSKGLIDAVQLLQYIDFWKLHDLRGSNGLTVKLSAFVAILP